MPNNDKNIQQKLEELALGIGAMGELLGAIRSSLITNGFTREEAVAMCTSILSTLLLQSKNEANN